MRVKPYSELFEILALDKINMRFSAQALISLKKGSVKDIVENYSGIDWYKAKVQKVFRSLVRNAVQKYNSGEIKANRLGIQNEVKLGLTEFLNGTPILLEKVVVGNIDFPAKIVNEIENRVAMEEKEKAMDIKDQIAKKEAKIRVTEAIGIRESQEIINASLTDRYLQYEAIKAQASLAGSPNHTTIYIPTGNNGIPIVKMQK
jgi:regulator of protease activity HflC (stomatin/prohibitin superfamily)